MSLEAAAPGKLDIGRTIRLTVDLLRRRWRELLRPALLLLYLPAAVVGLFGPNAGPSGVSPTASPVWALLSLVALLPQTMFQGALLRLAIADLRGETVTATDALAVGRERLWPLLAVGVLAGVGIGLGLLLFIVPGVILACIWVAVGPAVVEERRGIGEAFGRSAELTRGSRLNVFGVLVVLFLVELAGAAVFALLSAPFPYVLARCLIWPIYSAIMLAIFDVVVAAIYSGLVRLRGEAPAP